MPNKPNKKLKKIFLICCIRENILNYQKNEA